MIDMHACACASLVGIWNLKSPCMCNVARLPQSSVKLAIQGFSRSMSMPSTTFCFLEFGKSQYLAVVYGNCLVSSVFHIPLGRRIRFVHLRPPPSIHNIYNRHTWDPLIVLFRMLSCVCGMDPEWILYTPTPDDL